MKSLDEANMMSYQNDFIEMIRMASSILEKH